MKKLVLDLDRISVESFDTSTRNPATGGTVRGQQYAEIDSEYDAMFATMPASCNGTCFGKTKCGISLCYGEIDEVNN